MRKRILSLFMAVVLCLTLLPTSALAGDEDGSISGGTIGGGSTGEGGGVYVTPGPTEGGGGTYIPGEDTRTEIWRSGEWKQSIGRGYDGTTSADTISVTYRFTDGTNEIVLEEGKDCTAEKTFDSPDAGSRTVTVKLTLIGEAATKYKLKDGEEEFTIDGTIDPAAQELTLSLSKSACAVGEMLLPLLSISGVQEDAAVTYYYTQYKTLIGNSEYEGSDVIPEINENTVIGKFDEDGNNTYYLYAKTAATKNYKAGMSNAVELTVSNDVASVTTSGGETVSYSSLDDALDAAQDGDTVTLLGDAEVTKVHQLWTPFTLELNGKTATVQKRAPFNIRARIVIQDSSTEKTGNMVCDDSGTYMLNVQGGDLTIKSGTFAGKIAAFAGGESKLTIEGGTFTKEVNLGSQEAVSLSGGTFTQIWHMSSFLDLLADGYAFYDKDNKLVNAAKVNSSLWNASVRTHQHTFIDGTCACGYTCPHASVDASGTCAVCSEKFAASVTTVKGDVTYYDTFGNALSYATKNNGCTLKLLADVPLPEETTLSIDKPLILDLNGHSIDRLSVSATVKIRDSGTAKGTIRKLNVFNMTDADDNETVLTVADLLEEGYAFKSSSENKWYFGVEKAIANVTVQPVPIKSVTAKDPTVTVEYGKTSGVTLSATAVLATEGETVSYQWYKIGGTDSPIQGATDNTYQLPADLGAGKHIYRLTATSDGYPKSADITVNVTPISLKGATVTVQDLTYNGERQFPTVTVKLGETTLTKNKDFDVEATMQTNAGSYTLTIRGNGNYYGKIENVEWKIEPMKINSVMVSSDISKTYDGTAEVAKTAEEWAKVLTFKTLSPIPTPVSVPSDAYTISDAYFVEKSGEETIHSPDAGEKYGIAFKITLNDNNYVLQTYGEDTPSTSKEITQSGAANFTITQATVTLPDEIAQLVFNDLAKTYTLDLATLLPKLSEGCEYGKIQYQGCNYHFTDSTYLDSNNDMFVSKEGILTLPTVSVHTSNINTQIGTITVPVVTTNYQKFEFTIKVVISERIPLNASGVTVSASDITYGQTLNDSKLTITGSMICPRMKTEIPGTFAWTDGTIKPNAGDYTASWTFTPAEGYEEYAPATGTVTVKVAPAQLQNVSVTQGLPMPLYYTGQPQRAGVSAVGLGVCGERVTFTYSAAEDGEYTSEVPAFTDAGMYTVYYKAEAANHIPAAGTFYVQIDPLPISLLTIDKISKTYDGSADVTLSADMLTFFSKAAKVSNIKLPDTALIFSGAQFTRKQADGSYLPSPEVGNGKALSFTMTLTSGNYVFENEPEGTKTIRCDNSTDDVTKFTITKATAPTGIQTGTLNVVNGTTLTYTYDAKQFLPNAPKGTYGTVFYAGEPSSSLENGYAVDSCKVGINSGVLTLTIDAQNGGKTGKIGSVTIYVTTDNYETLSLPIDLYAINQITPVLDGSVTATDITYGDALSKSEISGKMKDPNTGAEVKGTFAWNAPDTVLNAGDRKAEWKFTPDDTEKYAEVTGKLTIKIRKATPTGEPKYTEITTGDKRLADAGLTITGSTLNPSAGTLEWVDDNGNVLPGDTKVKANRKYKWRFTPEDENYTVLTGEIELYHVSLGGYCIIKATAGAGGAISPFGNISIREGRDQTFVITPDEGYAVSDVRIDGRSIGAVLSYTFENVRGDHTIEASFAKSGAFVDVPAGSYYEDAVDWAVKNGITKGTDAAHFSPDGICTRAQAVTFLWRAAGSPAPASGSMPFADVPAGCYYYDAVLWAVENGITKGTSDTTFSPGLNCSRAQIVTLLWRFAKSPAAGSGKTFTDVPANAYYAEAVLWAVESGVTKGTSSTTFSPDAACTRAQIVTFLWRCKK